MDCLKSFYINIDNSTLWVSPDAETWGPVTDLNWFVRNNGISTFNIQGYKNINLYSVEMVGSCFYDPSQINGECVVKNYGFFLVLNGQVPEVSGVVTAAPNVWAINPLETELALTQFQNKLDFASPIQSLKSVVFNSFFASGTGAILANNIALRTNLTFIFKYKYEGE